MNPNPTRDAVVEQSRLAAIEDAKVPYCTECSGDIEIAGDTTCLGCRPHDYVLTLAVTLQYEYRIDDIERAFTAFLNEKKIGIFGGTAKVTVRSIEATEDTL